MAFPTYSKPVLLRSAREAAVIESYLCEEDVKQGQIVKEGGTNADEVEPSDTDGERVQGVALYDASSGEVVDVVRQGYVRLIAGTGSSISATDALASHGGTTDEGTVNTAASGDYTFGVARFAQATSGGDVEAYVDFTDSGQAARGFTP